MQTVYHAENIIDAHLVKDYLEQDDIPVFIAGEHLVGGVGQLPARDFVRVTVPDSFAETAAPRVREAAAMLSDARECSDDEPTGDPGTTPSMA